MRSPWTRRRFRPTCSERAPRRRPESTKRASSSTPARSMADSVFFGETIGVGEQSSPRSPARLREAQPRFGGPVHRTEQRRERQDLVVRAESRRLSGALEVTTFWAKKTSVVVFGGAEPKTASPAGRLTLTWTSRSLRCGGFGTGDCISAFRLRIPEGLAEEASLQARVNQLLPAIFVVCTSRIVRLCSGQIGNFHLPSPLPS